MDPTVSIVTPVYNGAAYLRPMLDSLLTQSWRDFELLIVNDGSTDDSLAILEQYAAQDERIHLINRENRGFTASINQLLYLARGQFVAQADHDDISAPDRLAQQVALLQQQDELVCVSGDHHLIDEADRYLTTLSLPQQNDEIQTLLLQGHSSICHACAMSRREAILAVGGWDESMSLACDLDLWLKLGEVGALANIGHPLLKYRLHVGSGSGKNGPAQRAEGRRAVMAAWQRRGISDGHYAASEPWRPTPERHSQHRFALKYGWWAFNSGQQSTAKVYARRALRNGPFSAESWQLLYATYFKQLPPAVELAW